MTDSATNAPEYTVSELSFALKRTVEDAYGFVRVRGEISSYRGPHSSGHAYFCLKDDTARIDAVVWRTAFQRLKFKPEEGLEVIATGKLTTYPGKSTYQIVIDQLEPAGLGALMALLEERRKKLAAEGLFDAARKQLLPPMPRVIGVVTSPTGAVIRDILHRIADRFPAHVIVWPVRVQGETAASEVAAAIHGFNALQPGGPIPRPDVILVARGGGSLEDLWAFNEEIVVRAAAESAIPLVSAVGHETDTTLIDFAADLRAPTPTAAAELVVPVRAKLLDRTGDLALRLGRAMQRLGEERRRHFAALTRALPRPETLLALPRQRLDAAIARLPRALVAEVQRKRLDWARAAARLVPVLARRGIERRTDHLNALGARLARCADAGLQRRREQLARLAPRLSADLLARPLPRLAQQLDGLAQRGERAYRAALVRRHDRLTRLADLMRALSYRSVLDRGFALVRSAEGFPLRSAAAVLPGARLDIEFADGRIGATAAGRSRTASAKAGTVQDDLFG